MDAVNQWDCAEFVKNFGCVVEHCPLAAASVWSARPFSSVQHLEQCFEKFLLELSPDAQEGVLRLHPELGTQKKVQRSLTSHSEGEQRGAGLLELADPQSELLRDLNTRYRATMNFPFVIYVAEAGGPEAVAAELQRRLELGGQPGGCEEERRRGLEAVVKIGGSRVRKIVAELQ